MLAGDEKIIKQKAEMYRMDFFNAIIGRKGPVAKLTTHF